MGCRGLLRYQSLSTGIVQVRVLEPPPCPQPADVSFFPGSFLPPAHMWTWMCSCVCVCVCACVRTSGDSTALATSRSCCFKELQDCGG